MVCMLVIGLKIVCIINRIKDGVYDYDRMKDDVHDCDRIRDGMSAHGLIKDGMHACDRMKDGVSSGYDLGVGWGFVHGCEQVIWL